VKNPRCGSEVQPAVIIEDNNVGVQQIARRVLNGLQKSRSKKSLTSSRRCAIIVVDPAQYTHRHRSSHRRLGRGQTMDRIAAGPFRGIHSLGAGCLLPGHLSRKGGCQDVPQDHPVDRASFAVAGQPGLRCRPGARTRGARCRSRIRSSNPAEVRGLIGNLRGAPPPAKPAPREPMGGCLVVGERGLRVS